MTRSIRHLTSLLVLLTCAVLAAGPPLDAAQPSPRLQVFFASDFTDQEYQKAVFDMFPDIMPEMEQWLARAGRLARVMMTGAPTSPPVKIRRRASRFTLAGNFSLAGVVFSISPLVLSIFERSCCGIGAVLLYVTLSLPQY